MEPTEITAEIFDRTRHRFGERIVFAQDVNALVSLIAKAMASEPVCSIVTPPFSSKERREFLAALYEGSWTARIASRRLDIKDDNIIVNYEEYTVRGRHHPPRSFVKRLLTRSPRLKAC